MTATCTVENLSHLRNHFFTPKFYFCDPRIVRSPKYKKGPVDSDETGALLEGCVLHLFRSYQSYCKAFDQIFYWRPADAENTEVDFLIEKNGKFTAIEVKSTVRVRSKDLKGLQTISELKDLRKKILIYMGKESQKIIHDIDVMNIETLSKRLEDNELF